jgi:hypothetical protein
VTILNLNKGKLGFIFYQFFVVGLRRPLFGLSYQPLVIGSDKRRAVGEMRIGRGNRSTRIKPAPVPLCPPQILHDLTWDRTRAAAVGKWRLIAWAMARTITWIALSAVRSCARKRWVKSQKLQSASSLVREYCYINFVMRSSVLCHRVKW